MVLVLTLVSVQYPFMYSAPWNIYLGAFLLPLIGFLFGYIVATIFRMEDAHRRTVSLETGIQNFPLCMTLLVLTFKTQMFSKIALFPLLYGVTCILTSLLFLCFYRIGEAVKKQRDKKEFSKIALEENQMI